MAQIQLTSSDDLTMSIVESGVVSWQDLIRVVEQFHYGRNQNREDLELVWTERKGTCSSKHAFLKHVADLNELDDITLILCMYKMSARNTNGVGSVLEKHKLPFVPEAHCYLKTPAGKIDVTNAESSFENIANDVLYEEIIQSTDVAKYKVGLHRKYINEWASENTDLSGDQVWDIREACIMALEQ